MTHRRLIALLLLLLALLPAIAQLKPHELSWKLGEKARQQGDDEGVVDFWQPLLQQAEWPFRLPRDEVQCVLCSALRRLGNKTEAVALAQRLLDAHPQDSYTDRAQIEQIAITLTAPHPDPALLTPVLTNPARSTDQAVAWCDALARELGDAVLVENALVEFLHTHADSPHAAALRLLNVRWQEARGDPRHALLQARNLFDELKGKPEQTATFAYVTRLYMKLGEFDSVRQLLATLPATTAHDPAITVLLAEVSPQLKAAADREMEITRIVPAALDDPLLSPQDTDLLLDKLSTGVPGAIYAVDRTLGDYLRKRPFHARYASLRNTQIRLLTAARDYREVLDRFPQVYPLVAGTPDEVPVLRAWATAATAFGAGHTAAMQLYRVSAYYSDPLLLSQALQAARAADDPATTETIVQRLARRKQAQESALIALSWLLRRAVTANDLSTAKRWCDTINTLAPEHPLAAKARKRLRAMQAKMGNGG